MSVLALHGGTPVRPADRPFPAPNSIGAEERDAALRVLERGELSRFLGAAHPDFHGGEEVQAFEAEWAELVGAPYAVSVNSNTSGLVAAVAAAGVGPGDEVIVTPYTMSASATAIVAYGAVPVFADIEAETGCLDPEAIRRRITPRTRALMVVHLFGHPADMDAITAIAREHDLVVIEDAAQAPGAVYRGRPVGSLGDMTVFSLNYHKHIHTGEGGVVTTASEDYARRLQLVRNHGECVVEDQDAGDLVNSFGFNFRLTELQAAIGRCQIRKLPALLEERRENVAFLYRELGRIPGIRPLPGRDDCVHAYYVQPFGFDAEAVGVSRERFVEAVCSELPTATDRDWPLLTAGYVTPLYLLPMYQKRVAFKGGAPFRAPFYEGSVDYARGLCPVCERLQDRELVIGEFHRPPMGGEDLRDVVRAFEKVYDNRKALAERDA